jgi:hypothetical protein
MNKRKFAISVVLPFLSLSSPLTVEATAPERATAHNYITPPAVSTNHALATTSGQSAAPPQIIEPYLHPAERRAVANWVWDVRNVFAAQTIVYAGWNHGRLINTIHFLKSSQPVFLRQYIAHYERTPNGDDLVTVERYQPEGGQSEKYAGKTVYISRMIENKLYLSSVEWTDSYAAERTRLDVQWTANGVKASVSHRQNRPTNLDLNSNKTWLTQHFDLWDEFGLRFQ